jgi:hypothetical protein
VLKSVQISVENFVIGNSVSSTTCSCLFVSIIFIRAA